MKKTIENLTGAFIGKSQARSVGMPISEPSLQKNVHLVTTKEVSIRLSARNTK